VRWWRTIHQIQSTPQTVDTAYAWGLRLNAIAFLLIFVYFVVRRYHAASVERAAERKLEEVSLQREEAYV
jgi:heme exporter protein C